MSEIKDALGALRSISKAFAPLATIGADVDRLEALVAHEDELTASIERKLAQAKEIDADIAAKLSACDVEIARKQEVQRNAEAGYVARLDALDRELKNVKAQRQARIDTETQAADRAVGQLRKALNDVKAAIDADRARITTEHDAFIEQTKQHRETIEANTKVLEDRLTALREQAKNALAATEAK